MASRRTSAALAAAAIAAACAGSRPAPAPPPSGPIVRAFDLGGARHIDAKEIRSKLATRVGRPFEPAEWQADLLRIPRYYQDRGFYDARVSGSEVASRPDGVAVRVTVIEGEPFRVSEVVVEGLDAVPPDVRSYVEGGLVLSRGAVFHEQDWEDSKTSVERRLRERGYAEAAAGGEAQVDLSAHAVRVLLLANPGRRYRFGDIALAPGPPRAIGAHVLEAARAAMPEGTFYSVSALQDAQRRVFDLGVFDAVRVNRGDPQPGGDRVPVLVQVTEGPSYTLRAGGGIAVEPSRDDVHARLEWVHREFLGGVRTLRVTARAGWAVVPGVQELVVSGRTPVNRSGPVAGVAADVVQPQIAGPDLALFGTGELRLGLEDAYRYDLGRLEAGVAWRPARPVQATAAYGVEAWRLFDTPLLGAGAPPPAYGCAAPCVLSYLEQRVAVDTRDDPGDPHEGEYGRFRLRESGGPLQGTVSFVEAAGEVRAYRSIGARRPLTLEVRLGAGGLVPLGGEPSPVVARFFSGGTSMRGFSSRHLSPMLLAPGSAVAVPVGGNGLLEGSIEARYALSPSLTVAGFVDAGAVDPAGFHLRALGRGLQWAVGPGLRLKTPVGPIRVDAAWRPPIGPPLPLYRLPGAPAAPAPARGCFGIGRGSASSSGAPEGACAIHIGIGEAF